MFSVVLKGTKIRKKKNSPYLSRGRHPVGASRFLAAQSSGLGQGRGQGLEAKRILRGSSPVVQGGAPPVISWFINPMNTIDISPPPQPKREIVLINQLNANDLGHHLVGGRSSQIRSKYPTAPCCWNIYLTGP